MQKVTLVICVALLFATTIVSGWPVPPMQAGYEAIAPEDIEFLPDVADTDTVMVINGLFVNLEQLGVGSLSEKNVIEAPIVCPAGKLPDKNGVCRDIFVKIGRIVAETYANEE